MKKLGKWIFVLCFCVKLCAGEEEFPCPYITDVQEPLKELEQNCDDNYDVHIEIPENYKGFIGTLSAPGVSLSGGNGKQFVVKDEETELHLIEPFDYEDAKVSNPFPLTCNKGQTGHAIIWFHITNVNDNPTKIEVSGNCKIDENNKINENIKECELVIQDADGMIDVLEYNIILPNDAQFQVQWQNNKPPDPNEKEVSVDLLAKSSFDFETVQFYKLTWNVNDREKPEYSASTIVIVDINDLPDEPPRWNVIFGTQQMKEHETKEFMVSAIDGDYTIEDEIIIKCSKVDVRVQSNIICPNSIDGTVNIKVNNIDRDVDLLDTVQFTITACEKSAPNMCADAQTATLIIEDINDNRPEITTPDTSVIELDEEKFDVIDYKVTINDIDLGGNARYDVELNSDIVDVDINEIITIIPTSGYQKGEFTLTIIDYAKLDYDREDTFRDFNVKIVARESACDHLIPDCGTDYPIKESSDINIRLRNLNDEMPEFAESAYTIEVLETIGRLKEEYLPIKNFKATDYDIDDCVTFEILGATMKKMLLIEQDDCPREPFSTDYDLLVRTIKQANERVQLFNYEDDPEVSLQIQARDWLVDAKGSSTHTQTVQITIQLIDVNDETPSITVTQNIFEIDENVGEFVVPEFEITANDDDKGADLRVEIDWANSFIYKNSQQLKWEEHREYYECLEIRISEGSTNMQKLAELAFVDKVPGNTPDYEVFDRMTLLIVVTDSKQEVGSDRNQVSLNIYINNINDNPPIIDEDLLQNMQVVEESPTGTLIGFVPASDPDFNELTYSISPNDLVRIDEESGNLYVNGIISADDPPTYNLKYDVTVSDSKYTDTKSFIITIEDINNRSPTFTEDLTDVIVEVPEKSDAGTSILKVRASDADRDDPNNKIVYSISGTQVNDYFTIDSDTGSITVKGGKLLDRDSGKSDFTVQVEITDSPVDTKQSRNDKQSFSIKVTDINDQKPLIDIVPITTDEFKKKGEQLGTINAHDGDEPGTPNSEIKFEIVDVKSESLPLKTDDLVLISRVNGVAVLTANVDLEGYYGEHTITVKTIDGGDLPQTDQQDIGLFVEKYNFNKPIFEYPNEGDVIVLDKDQKVGDPLILYEGRPMNQIKANTDPPGKYLIDYSIEDKDGNSKDVFWIDQFFNLKLKEQPEESVYKMDIVARDRGTPTGTSAVSITIVFFDDSPPIFASGNKRSVFQFDEESVHADGVNDHVFPPATLNLGEDLENELFTIYYVICQNPNNAFELNSEHRTLRILQPITIEELQYDSVSIQASLNTKPSCTGAEDSITYVDIILNDINNHWPFFEHENYYGGIMTTQTLDTPILQVTAQDLDLKDDLKYSIDWTGLTASDSSLDTTTGIFNINQRDGTISLNFVVKSSMDGYYTFPVIVDDSVHDSSSIVEIYVVTDKHLVVFVFNNDLNTVEQYQDEIVDIMSTNLGYTCVIVSITRTLEGNVPTSVASTDVTTYFIEDNRPVEKGVVKDKINDLETFGKIRSELLSYTLSLDKIYDTSESEDNTEDILKAWLIGVSVVLGIVCVLLIVLFVIKTRSLNQRIDKLTNVQYESQDSLHKIYHKAPATNMHAVEGANPVWKIDEARSPVDDIRRDSVTSADSDLFGVENNVVFKQNGI